MGDGKVPAMRPALVLVLCLAACGPSNAVLDAGPPDAGPSMCALLTAPDCTQPVPTYSELTPILKSSCIVCHDGAHGVWPLTSYTHLSDWEDTVRSEVLNCRMPPLDSGVPITYEERKAIFTWVRCGKPQ